MMTRITPRDWETLSAYLDGELNQKETRSFEARVQGDENLRASLDSLKLTRTLLRDQPIQRAPRNFTLSPQMAGVSRRRTAAPVFPVMRLASVLATFFLVVLSVGNLVASRMQPVQISQSSAIQQPAFGMGSGGGGADAPESLSMPEELPAAAQPELESGDMALEALPVEAVPTGTGVQAKAMATIPAPLDEPQIEALQQAPQAEQPLAGQAEESGIVQARTSALTLIGMLQIALAILAITTGAIAIFLYRTTR